MNLIFAVVLSLLVMGFLINATLFYWLTPPFSALVGTYAYMGSQRRRGRRRTAPVDSEPDSLTFMAWGGVFAIILVTDLVLLGLATLFKHVTGFPP